MQLKKIIRRFLIPAPVMTLYCLFKYKAKVSPKAEVELSPLLSIGPNSIIGSWVKIKATTGPLTIGRDVSISNSCTIMASEGGIEIGDDSMIASNVVIISNNYNYNELDTPIRLQGENSKGVKIGKNVWIGAGSVVLDGTVIEDGVIVSPLSLVSGRIKANAIVAGNPAKTIFTRR